MDYERYQKQIVLPKIGELGQKKICDSSVLIIGVGGIGCPTLVYLVSMGVGTIGIVDYDIVDISNLHRQFIYTNEDIGKYKVNCAKDFCLKRNNKTNINIYNLKLTNKITLELFINYDYILDCTDNIFSRHIINDACVLLNKKYFFSSAIGTSSQIGVFNSSIDCACYRCLNNNKNETCESSGVLGVTPGIVGNLLAMEVIKFILNYGEKLTSRLLTYDIYQGFYNVSVLKNKNCLICSKNAVINKNENFDSIQKSLDNGTFVDSNIVYNLVYEQFLLKPTCKRWLLDGYARNESLVNALNTTTASDGIENIIEKVVDFEDLLMKEENYKEQLLQFYQKEFKMTPEYISISVEGPPHNRIFTEGVLGKDGDIAAKGVGKKKQDAQQHASLIALKYFGKIV